VEKPKKTRFILKENSDCPVCGDGKIKRRKGKFGEFWGCSQYPSCGFAQSIPKEVDPLEKHAWNGNVLDFLTYSVPGVER
jgi:DNA topoisomerase III